MIRINANNRDAERVGSIFSAAIFVDGAFVDYCVIEDVSATGMRLKLSKDYGLPEAFELKIPGNAESIQVGLAWLRGMECGVKILNDQQQ